jgi:DNA-binding transcriptional LysR family regulator
MRFLKFDLNLLVALDALLTERNVTRAAERLNLGQSAASAALARLREYFHDELLVPSGREMRLTALGQSLLEPVRATLRQAQATIQLQPGFDPATSERHFTIATSDYVTKVLLFDVVRLLAEQAPHVRLSITRRTTDALARLERGEVDLLIVPENYPASPHPWAPLFEDEYVGIAWAGHPGLPKRPRLKDYLAWPHVVSRQRETRPYAFEDAYLPAGVPERPTDVFVDDFISLPDLVVGTPRLATVQRRLAERAVQRGLPLRLWPVPFPIPNLQETMRWHATADQDPALAWLRDMVQASAQPKKSDDRGCKTQELTHDRTHRRPDPGALRPS